MSNLTVEERERVAYITGDTERAELLANCQDVAELETKHEDEMIKHGEAEYSRGYKDGEDEATDTDDSELKEKLEAEQLKIKTLVYWLKRIEIELQPRGEYSTAAGRSTAAKAIRAMRLVNGWF